MVFIDPAIELMKNWEPIAAMAIILSSSLVALAYMIASFIGDEKLKVWSKSEAMQVFYSILILGLIISLYLFVNSVIFAASESVDAQHICAGVSGPSGAGQVVSGAFYYAAPVSENGVELAIPCHIALAETFLEDIFNNAKDMNSGILGTSTWYNTWSSASLTFEEIAPPRPSVTVVPLAGLSMVAESLTTAFEMTVRLMAIVRLQQLFIAIAHESIFPLFLVSGIILRTFFFTRKLGGLLIAIAISVYTILPGTYIIGGYILTQASGGSLSLIQLNYDKLPYPSFNPSNPSDLATNPATISGTSANLCQSTQDVQTARQGGAWAWTKQKAGSAWTWVTSKLKGIMSLFGGQMITQTYNGFKNNPWLLGDDGVIDNVAKLAIFTTLIPFIAIMATLAGIKVMSPMFGGDVDIPGLSRLI